MNILVPDSWLKEHLQTKATPEKIAECLSLCSQSVEKINRAGSDSVYDIEITTNRPDCLSIYGIARELAAILPRFGTRAKLQPIPEFEKNIPRPKKNFRLNVKIASFSLCPRFTALVFDQVKYQPSPKLIQDRLEKSGIRALNNIVDISNYLMLELGQPMHTFDYDKIKKEKMILRQAVDGEKITTLDGQTRFLPDRAIIIEDGEGRIIDLCGIMGGQNSQVDEKTKRVLLFIQTYNPTKIRQTCQKLAFQTEAAQRFEKGIEPEGVIPAMKKAVAMFKNLCQAKVASRLIDIYPQPIKIAPIELTSEKLNQAMGVPVKLIEAQKILTSLGFKTKMNSQKTKLIAAPPHWRQVDMVITEDLIEEVARIYGYHNLPSILPKGQLPQVKTDIRFTWETKIKQALKFWGFVETASYSMTNSEILIENGFDPQKCLKISNPLNKDLVYMRPSLIPSLLEVVNNNPDKEELKIFELSNIYLNQGCHQLPWENLRLAGLIKGGNFFQAKGIVEAVCSELTIKELNFQPAKPAVKIFHPFRSAEIQLKEQILGFIGETVDKKAVIFDLDFDLLAQNVKETKKYIPLRKYPAVIEDLSFIVPPESLTGEIIQLIKSVSLMIQSVKLIDTYQNTRTFKINYQNPKKNLSSKEVEKIREKIIKKIKEKFNANLKESLTLS